MKKVILFTFLFLFFICILAYARIGIMVLGGPPATGSSCLVTTENANLVALYRFETATLGADTKNNFNLSNCANAPTRVQNSSPQGSYNASFTTNQCLEASANWGITGDYTVCVWAYLDVLTNEYELIEDGADHEDGFNILIEDVTGTKYWSFVHYDGWTEDKVLSTTAVSATTWTHVCMVYDQASGNDMFVYLNGNTTPDAQTDGDGLPYTAAADHSIGVGVWGTYLEGDLDEVAIFNAALSTAQIAAIYSEGICDP